MFGSRREKWSFQVQLLVGNHTNKMLIMIIMCKIVPFTRKWFLNDNLRRLWICTKLQIIIHIAIVSSPTTFRIYINLNKKCRTQLRVERYLSNFPHKFEQHIVVFCIFRTFFGISTTMRIYKNHRYKSLWSISDKCCKT